MLGTFSSLKLQSSKVPFGKNRRIVIGIFRSCSSFFAMTRGSVSSLISTIGGAPILSCNARVPRIRAGCVGLTGCYIAFAWLSTRPVANIPLRVKQKSITYLVRISSGIS